MFTHKKYFENGIYLFIVIFVCLCLTILLCRKYGFFGMFFVVSNILPDQKDGHSDAHIISDRQLYSCLIILLFFNE